MKTPTAVAEFLISGIRSFEEKIISIENRLHLYAERLLNDAAYSLNSLVQRFSLVPSHITTAPQNHLNALDKNIRESLRHYLQHKENRLSALEQAVRLLDPINVLKRGYSITRHNGQALRDTTAICKGDEIETRLYKGSIMSIADTITTNNQEG
jgi:exodeoxyribonuclease VII large subunit